MSMNDRTARALSTLVRLREIEEQRALEGMAQDRERVEIAERELAEIEEKSAETSSLAEEHHIRVRAYLANLERSAEQRRDELEERSNELDASRKAFSSARSKRRVFETLLHRRRARVRSLEETE